jgi:hypothetical protein
MGKHGKHVSSLFLQFLGSGYVYSHLVAQQPPVRPFYCAVNTPEPPLTPFILMLPNISFPHIFSKDVLIRTEIAGLLDALELFIAFLTDDIRR